jgi:Collagen triple helix repeat (20 copies)
MLSRLRTHFGSAGLIVAIVALIAALGGGALAATGGGGSGASASAGKQGPRGKQGKTGKTGPQGPAGAAGAQGPAGPVGPAGAKGDTGNAGAQGIPGPQGIQGIQGEDGETGFTETLPPGKTETGTYAGVGQEGTAASMTFAIPLSAPIAVSEVRKVEFGEVAPAECAGGTPENPKALPGYLCVYNGFFSGFEIATVANPAAGGGASVAGAAAIAGEEIEGPPPRFLGTFAVTACGGTEFPCP